MRMREFTCLRRGKALGNVAAERCIVVMLSLCVSNRKKQQTTHHPRLPQEAGILRDVSRQPACPPSQAPSPIYLHRDDPSTQAPIPRTATQHKRDFGARFLNGRVEFGARFLDSQGFSVGMTASEGHMFSNDLASEGQTTANMKQG